MAAVRGVLSFTGMTPTCDNRKASKRGRVWACSRRASYRKSVNMWKGRVWRFAGCCAAAIRPPPAVGVCCGSTPTAKPHRGSCSGNFGLQLVVATLFPAPHARSRSQNSSSHGRPVDASAHPAHHSPFGHRHPPESRRTSRLDM